MRAEQWGWSTGWEGIWQDRRQGKRDIHSRKILLAVLAASELGLLVGNYKEAGVK